MRQAPSIQYLLLLVFVISSLTWFQVFGFSPVTLTKNTPSLFLSPLSTSPLRLAQLAAAAAEGFTIADHRGNTIQVGSIVRVIANNLKAYQVSPKGFGKFDSVTGTFIPVPEGGARGTKNLEIPVGLVGTVTKVYNQDDVSANFPIQVKFVPDAPFVEKYNPTVPFLMHFLSDEVECVE